MSTAGNQSTDIVTSQDYLYLPSYTEVGFGTGTPYINEIDPDVYGSTKANAVWPVFTDNASRIKRIGGSAGTATIWWLRSPNHSSSSNWFAPTTSGAYGQNAANNTSGVAFGFSI